MNENIPYEQHPMTMEVVETTDRFDEYVDAAGDQVFIAHGTGQRLVDLEELDLPLEWHRWLNSHWTYQLSDWTNHLESLLIDPAEAGEVEHCGRCNGPRVGDDMCWINEDEKVCASCFEDYTLCQGGCECWFLMASLTRTLADS